ncbi:glutamate receptor ionotropic, kainate 2-like [Macrobrachium nipponense]|uniref:glutamate receptor ionotropic, kainate 2-like n=1 Tax=Macrobrachium nipponense TaxID=159736 RepID=UPI0030C88AAC
MPTTPLRRLREYNRTSLTYIAPRRKVVPRRAGVATTTFSKFNLFCFSLLSLSLFWISLIFILFSFFQIPLSGYSSSLSSSSCSPHSSPHPLSPQTEMALMYDAVHLFAKALGDLDRSRPIEVARLDCEGDDTWIYGNSLVNYMKWVQVRGLTGLIKFDAKGFRRDVTLDIVELTKTGLVKVGRWNPTSGANYTKSYREVEQDIVEELRRKNLVISSVLEPPYVMLQENSDGGTDSSQQRLEGFCIDLVREISQMLLFNYTVKLADDGTYGMFDADSGKWNGMIRELLEQKADLAIGDLTITHEREQVVDFTVPWMNLGVSILYRKSSKKTSFFFRFLSPVSADVWLSVASAYLVVSVMLFTIARFSPYEWTESHQCDTTEGRINEFSLLGSFWFCFGSLVQQGGNALPRAISTRIIAGVWWFFTLIMISSYTANLTAFLMAERLETLVESVDDLAKSQIQYGTLNGGSTWNFFRTSKLAIYQKMFNFMESQTPTVYSTSNEEGVSKVLKGDGQYAYIMESPSIEFATERHCDLIQVGGLLNSRSYGIALPPGSPYRTLINSALGKLQETGRLTDLKHKWWKVERGGGACQTKDDHYFENCCHGDKVPANVPERMLGLPCERMLEHPLIKSF